MSTSHDAVNRPDDDHAAWWAGLSPENRYMVIEMVRLDQDPQHIDAERPTAERAEFVRQQPEYLERFASAERIAEVDQTEIGRDLTPEAHDRTAPLTGRDA